MTANHRLALERFQRAQRMFAFQRVELARDDSLPITVRASVALAAGLPEKPKVHAFPVRVIFTPFKLKEAA